MNLPKLSFHFGKKARIRLPKFSREKYILWSVALFVCAAVVLLGYDAYIFYQNVIERAQSAPAARASQKFSESDIDEIITLLDEREKKFNEILSGNK